MDTATAAIVIAAASLAIAVLRDFLNGGWRLSGRMSAIETDLHSMRENFENNFSELSQVMRDVKDVLVTMANIEGRINVTDANVTAVNERVRAVENDFRDLRRGHGWITGGHGIDREYP